MNWAALALVTPGTWQRVKTEGTMRGWLPVNSGTPTPLPYSAWAGGQGPRPQGNPAGQRERPHRSRELGSL